MFKSHLWSTTKLSWTTSLCNKEIDSLLKNKHWIRSLTIDAEHVETMSDLGVFTTLQELVFSDGNTECRQEEHGVVKVESLIALIDSNTHLQSLKIDLHNHHYSSLHLSSALIIAITRHQTLSKLTWLIPEDHNVDSFARRILYACHSRPIQELYICERPTSRPKPYQWCYQEDCTTCFPHYHYYDQEWFEDYVLGDGDTTATTTTTTTTTTATATTISEYTDFSRKLDQSLDELGVFALQRLHLESHAFNKYRLQLLNASPKLLNVALCHFRRPELETLAGDHVSSLRGLDFRDPCIHYSAFNYATELERFSLHWLQSVKLPHMARNQFFMAMNVLQKEIDFDSVRLYLRGGSIPDVNREPCVQSLGDLYSMATIARDWDPTQKRRPNGDMADWWKHWNHAKGFMKAVRKEYLHQLTGQSCRRPIQMRFMYPFRAFMSRAETEEYRKLRGGPGFTLTDAYCMAKAIEEEVERKKEEDRRERNAEMGVDSEEDSEEEDSDGEWSGYDQVKEELEMDREYSVAKSRNRHYRLQSKKRSTFQKVIEEIEKY
ncbi:hypothetical protein BGZ82_010937 [Podila clonocystis]|nr:hypothetical protein BGZ82_010937 [Podila clonocystis]